MYVDRLEVSESSRTKFEYEGRVIQVVNDLALTDYLRQLHQIDPKLVIQVYNSSRPSKRNAVWSSGRINPIELATDGRIEAIEKHFSLVLEGGTYLSYVGIQHLYEDQIKAGRDGDVYLRLQMKAKDLRKLATETGAGSLTFNIDPYT